MILLTLNVTSEPTSECRPCGHMEARAMALHRRGGIYHYHFWVDGTRYRGSTKKANLAAARRVLGGKEESVNRGICMPCS
jgi:hypothetical protein